MILRFLLPLHGDKSIGSPSRSHTEDESFLEKNKLIRGILYI